jgi:hypothetical protein
LAALLIRVTALLSRSIRRALLRLLSLMLLTLTRRSLAGCFISMVLGLGAPVFLRPGLSFLVRLADLVSL